MSEEHKATPHRRQKAAGAHPHVYSASDTEIPTFKRKKTKRRSDPTTPRYAPILAIGWVVSLFIAIVYFTKSIDGWDIDDWHGHYFADALMALSLLVVITLLWEAYEREERYPQLLPKREFDRRYPPSSAAPPTLPNPKSYIREITPAGDPRSTRRATIDGSEPFPPQGRPQAVGRKWQPLFDDPEYREKYFQHWHTEPPPPPPPSGGKKR